MNIKVASQNIELHNSLLLKSKTQYYEFKDKYMLRTYSKTGHRTESLRKFNTDETGKAPTLVYNSFKLYDERIAVMLGFTFWAKAENKCGIIYEFVDKTYGYGRPIKRSLIYKDRLAPKSKVKLK